VRALDNRHWGIACSILVPEARDYLGGPTCAAAYRRRFRDHLSFEPHWTRTRILRLGAPAPSGALVSVDLRVALTYSCPKRVRSVGCPSQAGTFRRPDRLYFRHEASGTWAIARSGLITQTIGFNGPYGPELLNFPPAPPDAISHPASGLLPPPFACPATPVVARADDPGDVGDGSYEEVGAPWLDIRRIAVTRAGRTACLSIELAEDPRPDTRFSLEWMRTKYGEERGGGGSSEIVIDGTGVAHATNQSWSTRSYERAPRPRFGFDGRTLQVELNGAVRFDTRKTYGIKAITDAEPSQYEPLLPSPMLGRDEAPDGSCLAYPKGNLLQTFMCQGPSG
jgi:hypothetical protein